MNSSILLYTWESPLKMIKNAFYFMFKALFVPGYLNFCSDLYGPLGKRLDKKKGSVDLKFYDVTTWETIN